MPDDESNQEAKDPSDPRPNEDVSGEKESTRPDQADGGRPPRAGEETGKKPAKGSRRRNEELKEWYNPDDDLPESVIPQLAPLRPIDVPDTPRPGEREYNTETETELDSEIEIVGPFGFLDRAIDWFRRAPVMGTIKIAFGTLVIVIPIVLISLDDGSSQGEPGSIEFIEESETDAEPDTPEGGGSSDIHLTDPAGDGSCDDSGAALDPALDIRGAHVVQQGDTMAVTVPFNGNAEAYNASTSDTFPVSFQLRLLAGGPYPEAFFSDKDNMKVSGGLLSVLSYEFSGNELIMLLTGRTLEDVMAVRVSTFVFGDAFCEDEVKSARYDE